MINVNYLAVVASAVASMVIGSIWYGPLFGKIFMREMGMDKWSAEEQAGMKKKMLQMYGQQFVASLVMFYVFAWLVGGLNQISVVGGLAAAFWVWLGFVVPLKFGDALWGGKMSLFWLGIGEMLLTLLAGGVIIGMLK